MGKAFRIAHPSDIKTVIFDGLKREMADRKWSDMRMARHFGWKRSKDFAQLIDRRTFHSETLDNMCQYANIEFMLRHNGKNVFKTDQYSALADYIRRLAKMYRFAKNYTQRGFGEEVGSKYPYFERKESNSTMIVVNVAEVLGYELYVFFSGLKETIVQCTDMDIEVETILRQEMKETLPPEPVPIYARQVKPGNGRVVNGFTGW